MNFDKLWCKIFVLLLVGSGNAFGTILHWSMESHDGASIYPDDVIGEKWKGDLSMLPEGDYFVPGVSGNALNVKNKVTLSQMLLHECVYDVMSCAGDEFTISFWIKLLNWNPSDKNGIIQTSDYVISQPGVFIGDNEGKNQIKFVVLTSSGDGYLSVISLPQLNQWIKLEMRWSAVRGIDISINDTKLSEHAYIIHSQNLTGGTLTLNGDDLEVGNIADCHFYLDELIIQEGETTETVTISSTCPECFCPATIEPTDEHTLSELEITLTAIVAGILVVMLAVVLAVICLRKNKTHRSGSADRIYHGNKSHAREHKVPFVVEDRESDFN